MRVTHVITRLIAGGAQENTIASVLGLRRKPDLSLELVSGPTSGPEGSLEEAVATVPGLLRIVPDLVRPIHPWKDVRAFQSLTEIFRAERPHLVHTHSGKAGLLGRLAARRAGVPLIVHTIHGPSFGPFQGRAANALFRAAERAAGRITTHFVSVAEAMTRQYLAAGIGQPAQFTRIFSGFALDPFLAAQNDPKVRARYGLAPDAVVVGKVARLFALKGHEDLLAIARPLLPNEPRIKFLLVGDGPWRERLERTVRAMNLQRQFVFAGWIRPERMPELLGIMDVVVHLSRREGLPRAVSQALAAGKPVVVYDSDGANEVCRNEVTGFLISPGDRSALAARVSQLAADPGLRERLGRNGQALVRKHFSVEQMVEELYQLYRRLAAQRGIGLAPVERSGQPGS